MQGQCQPWNPHQAAQHHKSVSSSRHSMQPQHGTTQRGERIACLVHWAGRHKEILHCSLHHDSNTGQAVTPALLPSASLKGGPIPEA
eukprot:1136650-Pelagomonas_calceolata.AAC.4